MWKELKERSNSMKELQEISDIFTLNDVVTQKPKIKFEEYGGSEKQMYKKNKIKLSLKKKKKRKIKTLKKIINMTLICLYIKRLVNQRNQAIRKWSVNRFYYYINNEAIEVRITNWMHSVIKMPLLSTLQNESLCFDITKKFTLLEENDLYIKLEVSFI